MPATLPVSYTSASLCLISFPPLGSASNVNSAVIALYAGQEEAYMNSKLGKLYTLPFTEEIPVLTAIATDLTIAALLTKRVTAHFTTVQNRDNPFIALRKQTMEFLDKIADGEIQMLTASGAVVPVNTSGIEVYSTTKTYNPTFHEGQWTDMVVDPNKLQDILNARGL